MTPYKYTKAELPPKVTFLYTHAPKFLLVVDFIIAILYTATIIFWFKISNPYIFTALIIGQLFSLWMGLTFLYTIWDTSYLPKGDDSFTEPVDVFITVAGEPVEIVEQTLLAALDMDYPTFKVYLLNDGYVRNTNNWQDIERLAVHYGAGCITRKIPGGAKAGNINNGLKKSL